MECYATDLRLWRAERFCRKLWLLLPLLFFVIARFFVGLPVCQHACQYEARAGNKTYNFSIIWGKRLFEKLWDLFEKREKLDLRSKINCLLHKVSHWAFEKGLILVQKLRKYSKYFSSSINSPESTSERFPSNKKNCKRVANKDEYTTVVLI